MLRMSRSTNRGRTIVLCLGLALGGAGCVTASAARGTEVSDRLFFGQTIPGGDVVRAEDWASFLRDVITPRFPQGLTVWRAEGQWLEQTGTLAREPVVVVEVIHPRNVSIEDAVAFITMEYKRRFRQEAVLRVTTQATMRIYDDDG
jgi:hypothetical protein